jgi:hypothetical protein
MRLIRKFFDLCVAKGPVFAAGKIFSHIAYRFGTEHAIETRRRQIAATLNSAFNSTVRYGPFKGLKFSDERWWGIDRAGMLLGLYEQEILDSLVNIPKQYKVLIDLGAADGYYGIGALINNLFAYSYCFEASESGRNILKRNAEINGVSARVSIHGLATKDFYKSIRPDHIATSVLLVDIEGGEFDLLDKELLRVFRSSIIFVELHDRAEHRLARLRSDASDFFDISELTTTSRDLSKFPELSSFSDTDRWLICSEGRPCLMAWYRLDPKSRSDPKSIEGGGGV